MGVRVSWEEYSQDKSYIKGYDDLDEILLGMLISKGFTCLTVGNFRA